jgi:PPK2 family polyphosphate:nucleotide phosphotransferase
MLGSLIVEPGSAARLDRRDPAWDGGPEFQHLGHDERRARIDAALARSVIELEEAHELLWANGHHGLLVVLQAMDAAGKDGTIRHVLAGVNPTGVDVVSFKTPSTEELTHDFLWRAAKAMPARGRITIFNRSHYEEVIAVRVHPDWLEREGLPSGPRTASFWAERFDSINSFEQHAARNGTKIVKLFLHVSNEEQRRRLLARLDEPGKEWKFSAADLTERALWDDYMTAFEEAISATSTPWAPWHVIPADHKPLMRALAAAVIVAAVQSLDLHAPIPTAEQHEANERARAQLEAEAPQ